MSGERKAIPMVDAILAAAGRGRRMGETPTRKQFLFLGGRPLLSHCLEALRACPQVRRIILAVSPEDLLWVRREWLPRHAGDARVELVEGGAERQDTVANALMLVSGDCEAVLIHDGARPLAAPGLFRRCIEALPGFDGVVPVVPCRDTVKEVREGLVVRTLDRGVLFNAQTPQVFRREALLDSYRRARTDGFTSTDDAALLERYGYRVRVVEGETANLKVTFPEDLAMAEALLRGRGSIN